MFTRHGTNSLSKQIIGVFLVLTLGIGTIGYSYYNSQKREAIEAKDAELSGIATIKVHEISRWRTERLDDAQAIAENPLIAQGVKEWKTHPDDLLARQNLSTWMKLFRNHLDYTNAFLTDSYGNVELSTSGADRIDSVLNGYYPGLLASREPILSDFLRSEADQKIYLYLLIPIPDPDHREAPVLSVLLVQINPAQFLYPLIQKWPTPSPSAETLLVRRQGDEVVYLNELRHAPGTALSLRKPADETVLPAARAVLGAQGVIEGIDYRGVPVLASLHAIPDSSWFLVTKVDREEVFAPIQQRARLIALAVILLILSAWFVLALIWSQQKTRFYRQQQVILQRTHEELEQCVSDRTAELSRTNEELRQKAALLEQTNRELQEFAFVASHDLQEPLRKIQLFSSALQGKFSALLGETALDYLQRMQSSAGHMQELISALKEYSQITALPEPFEPIELEQLFHRVYRHLSEQITALDADVEIACSQRIEARNTQIERLFEHLIGNALTFRGDGTPRVRVWCETAGAHCRILVQDNGIGFDPKYLARIFRPFQRLGSREDRSGIGMGLAICRRIVEVHNGSITAQSTPGEGSTFIVTLPIEQG